MAVQHLSDGVKIGADIGGNDRLAIYEVDEYAASIAIGELAGGAVATFSMESVPNLRAGATIFAARPMNPSASEFNYQHLLVLQVYQDVSEPSTVKLMVKNLSSSTVDFGEDQWNISHLNTCTPPEPE